ncbi:MAG: hypothetical protein K6G91_06385 [Kiritimatiellae bacterium]|nr:hypothetical protein [Kiritimatiellia bacterium]
MEKPFAFGAAVLALVMCSVANAAKVSASTSLSAAGRVEFSQGGQLAVGNDIFAISANNYARQIENTDVGMKTELYAMGQRTSWKGRYISIEKFLEPQGDGSFTVTWSLDIKPCGEPAAANLCLEVPPESFDELPPQQTRHPDADGVFRLNGLFGGLEASVAGSDGTWVFEDFRKAAWSGRFRFRCSVPYTGLAPWKGRLSMNFMGTATRHPAFRVLDVSAAATTGLTDETDGDGKGGWTDQGRNDLSPLAKGADLMSRFVPLKVTSRAIVLAGGERLHFPAESREISVGFTVRRLDFLHAVAWAGNPGSVAFRYRVRYADGTTAEIPVVTGEDVNDWHGVVEPKCGYIAWEGANSASSLALHHSRWVNPAPEKAVAGLTVLGNPEGGAVPMVLGVTALDAAHLTDRQFRALENLFVNKPRNDVDTSGWYPCELPWGGPGRTIAAGTALDASAALATSAAAFDRHACGDYGRLVAVGNHLEFERRPGERVAVWGVNFASNSSSPPKDLAQGIADNLKRQGVNMVRFHKFGGHPGRQMTPDGVLLPELQDRMDYFVSILKKSGIYVYIDWEDLLAFPQLAGPWPFKKGLVWAPVFMPSFRKSERDYARALFGHVNPYTGLSYAEDPTVACIEILNEADLCTVLNGNPRQMLDPEFYGELDRQWREWNAARGRPEVNSIADDVGNPDRLRFTADVQRGYQQSQRAFLVEELGYRGLVTGNNIVQHAYAATAIDDGMDFAGLHGYVGHIPGYYNTPYDNTSVVRTVSPGIPFFGQTWARPADKPYCFGEWNFCYPNDYRSEGLPFTTAMMALQGWDMSLFYAFDGPMTWGDWEHLRTWGLAGVFACGAGMDPSTWGLTVPCAIAFRRGDIRPSKNVITVSHTRDELLKMGTPYLMRQMQLSWMFMLGRVYTEVADKPDLRRWPMKRSAGLGEWDEIKSVAADLGVEGVTDGLLVSDTGEMKKFVGDGLFLLDTPRSKFALGNLSSMGRDGRVLSGVAVKSPETFAALTLTSLDAEPSSSIESARRVLVCLVGNSRNEAAVVHGRMIIDPGWEKSRTVLAEPLEATLAFPNAKGPFKVYRLSPRTGKRLGEMPVDADGGFTIQKSAHTIYFEVVREPSAGMIGK